MPCRRRRTRTASRSAAVRGVLGSIRGMLNSRVATHVGVATDHVIESFRNDMWPGYKTSEGIEPDLLSQFHLLEEALSAFGVVVWPMVEHEADDALAAAAVKAAADPRVTQVRICTPDKDLAQSVERHAHRAGRSSAAYHSRRGRRDREVRRGARVDSGLPRACRRFLGRLPGTCRAGARSRQRRCSRSLATSKTFLRTGARGA